MGLKKSGFERWRAFGTRDVDCGNQKSNQQSLQGLLQRNDM
jgi:hypothetical protein